MAPSLKAGVLDPQQNNYFKHLTTLIPSSIFPPFLEHQVMGVLLIGIVIGLAIRHIPDENPRQSVTDFFVGVHGLPPISLFICSDNNLKTQMRGDEVLVR